MNTVGSLALETLKIVCNYSKVLLTINNFRPTTNTTVLQIPFVIITQYPPEWPIQLCTYASTSCNNVTKSGGRTSRSVRRRSTDLCSLLVVRVWVAEKIFGSTRTITENNTLVRRNRAAEVAVNGRPSPPPNRTVRPSARVKSDRDYVAVASARERVRFCAGREIRARVRRHVADTVASLAGVATRVRAVKTCRATARFRGRGDPPSCQCRRY